MSATLIVSEPCRPSLSGVPAVAVWGLDRVACGMTRVTAALAARAFMIGAALVGGANGTARAQSAGEVVLPLDLSAAGGAVAVEIDGVDMTDFVRIEGGQLIISAGAPLAPGRHQAIVYVLYGNSYDVFATYSFETTARGPSSRDAAVTVTANTEAGVQSLNGEAEGVFESGGQLSVETLDESVTAWVTYLATTSDEEQVNGHFADIAEYSIEIRRSGALLDLVGRIGHQTLTYDTALVSEITRRGISVEATGPTERLELGLFGLRTAQALGSGNILGIADGEDRMFGGHIAFRPFWSSDLRFSLQAYDGHGPAPGATDAGTGSGVSAALDGSAVEGRLRYGLTVARVDWDEDGPLPFVDETTSDAILASIDYDLLPGDSDRFLTLGFDYERVDEEYFSLANPGLPPGGETFRLTADYAAERLTLFGTLETTKTNIGGDPTDAVDRDSLIGIDGTWLFYGPGLLADATLTFGASYDWTRQIEAPLLQAPEDWDALTLYVGLAKSGDALGWSVDYTYIDENDHSAFNFDLVSHEVNLWLDWTLNDRLSLNGSALLGFYDDAVIGRYHRHEGTLAVDYELDPGAWTLSLDMGVTDTSELGLEGGAYVAGELAWSVTPAADLVFNAGYYDGSYAVESGTDHDAIVGVLLRVGTNYTR